MPTVEIPVTMNEMLLRGCMLKNSKCIAGLAVYTGKETRIQMNAAKTPLKIGECGWVGRQGGVGVHLATWVATGRQAGRQAGRQVVPG